jgi:hypothetical protein
MANGVLKVNVGGVWQSLQGPQGPVGPIGPQGPKGDTGATGPSGTSTPHHVTHETGGTDAIVALSGAVITTGTVADARLSANVLLLNAANNAFTGNITIGGGLTMSGTGSIYANNILQTAANYVYPGRADGGANYQASWWLGSHASYGLYSNTGLFCSGNMWCSTATVGGSLSVAGTTSAGGSITMKNAAYVYPGSVSGLPAYQASYYMASHSAWGLYINTGLFLEGSVYAGTTLSATGAIFITTNNVGYYVRGVSGVGDLKVLSVDPNNWTNVFCNGGPLRLSGCVTTGGTFAALIGRVQCYLDGVGYCFLALYN